MTQGGRYDGKAEWTVEDGTLTGRQAPDGAHLNLNGIGVNSAERPGVDGGGHARPLLKSRARLGCV